MADRTNTGDLDQTADERPPWAKTSRFCRSGHIHMADTADNVERLGSVIDTYLAKRAGDVFGGLGGVDCCETPESGYFLDLGESNAVERCTAGLSEGVEKSGCETEYVGSGSVKSAWQRGQQEKSRCESRNNSVEAEFVESLLPQPSRHEAKLAEHNKQSTAPSLIQPLAYGPGMAPVQPMAAQQQNAPSSAAPALQPTVAGQQAAPSVMNQVQPRAGAGMLQNGLSSRTPDRAAAMPGTAGHAATNTIDQQGGLDPRD